MKIIIGKALKARGQDVPFEIPAKATSLSSGVKAKREDLIDDEVSRADNWVHQLEGSLHMKAGPLSTPLQISSHDGGQTKRKISIYYQ